MVGLPIYVYKCESCDHKFEERQSYGDEPLNICPKCGCVINRIIFATPVHYKGAGFSITETRGITGRKRKPNIKVGTISDLPPEERAKYE